MVAALAADVERLGLSQTEVRLMDAERLDFPAETFDCVLCGFGLMFFPQPEAALVGFRRVLRPCGRLALSYVPLDGLQDPRWAWRRELFRELGFRPPPGPAPFKGTDELGAAVTAAGFDGISVVEERTELRFADPAEYWAWTWSHGMRQMYEAMDPRTLGDYRRRAFEHLKAQHARGELAQSVHALFLMASRP
jgi:SAM-dependent methyltransferase